MHNNWFTRNPLRSGDQAKFVSSVVNIIAIECSAFQLQSNKEKKYKLEFLLMGGYYIRLFLYEKDWTKYLFSIIQNMSCRVHWIAH
jgi:hypothetical protein